MRRSWFGVLGLVAGLALATVSGAAEPTGGPSRQVSGGGVTVTATLLEAGTSGTAVKLVLETHAVNLDGYRLEAVAALRDEGGEAYPLKGLEQATESSHHRQGVLRFAGVRPGAREITLTVTGVAGVPERTFRFPVGG